MSDLQDGKGMAGVSVTLLLQLGIKLMDLAPDCGLLGWSPILGHPGQRISGVGDVLNRVSAARERKLAGGDLLPGRGGELGHPTRYGGGRGKSNGRGLGGV